MQSGNAVQIYAGYTHVSCLCNLGCGSFLGRLVRMQTRNFCAIRAPVLNVRYAFVAMPSRVRRESDECFWGAIYAMPSVLCNLCYAIYPRNQAFALYNAAE